MNAKKWTLLVVMVGVLLATAFANDGKEINKNRADFMKERKAYFKEHVKPLIDAQRKILDTSLKDEDKKEIAALREEIIKQRLLQNEFRFDARTDHIKGDEVNEDLLLELQAQKIVIENLRDEAKIIANKYRPEIDDLVADLKTSYRENGKDMKDRNMQFNHRKGGQGKRGQYGPNETQMRGDGFGHRNGRGSGPGIGQGSPGGFDIVSFLLWDVSRS